MTSPTLSVSTIEVHAEGEPGRIVPDAARFVQGETMAERFDYCVQELNPLRHFLLREPRGYPGTCGVFLLPPVSEEADFGIIVLEQANFTPMSGSNTICAVTAAIETGIVAAIEPVTEVVIDTAIGVVRAAARVENGKVLSVSVANVPAFTVAIDHPLVLPEYGEIKADIVFGGQFFAQLDVSQLGLELKSENGKALARAGAMVKIAAQQQVQVQHPLNPSINLVNLIMLHNGDRAVGKQAQNTVVLTNGVLDPARPDTWSGALDRSPCGTGTSARMAALHSRGQLAIGEDFSHHSILGTEFIGRLEGETEFGGQRAVLPTITGRGWITGRATWELDQTDPFQAGYTLGDIWAS